jgi:hypothetical protein
LTGIPTSEVVQIRSVYDEYLGHAISILPAHHDTRAYYGRCRFEACW